MNTKTIASFTPSRSTVFITVLVLSAALQCSIWWLFIVPYLLSSQSENHLSVDSALFLLSPLFLYWLAVASACCGVSHSTPLHSWLRPGLLDEFMQACLLAIICSAILGLFLECLWFSDLRVSGIVNRITNCLYMGLALAFVFGLVSGLRYENRDCF